MKDIKLFGFKGIRNTVEPERAKGMASKDDAAVDLTAATNVDLDDSGMLSRRDGLIMKSAGASHSLWSNGDLCFFMRGGDLFRLNDDFTVAQLAQGLRGTPSVYVEVNGRTYFSNGAQTGVIDGTCRSWGMELPPTPGLTAVAGTLGAGTYQVVLTHVRADGQESGAGLPGVIEVGENGGVVVDWPEVDDASIEYVNVYLSTPNGMVLYRADTVDSAESVTTLRGPALVYPLATQWLDKPPAGNHLAYSQGRIFIAVGNTVYATGALGYELVDLRDYLPFPATIVFMMGVKAGLYVGTEAGVYFCSGTRLDEFTLALVVSAPAVPKSAVLADAAAITGNEELAGRRGVIFSTADGVYMGTEDGTITNLTQERYGFRPGRSASAVFRLGAKIKQYLLFMLS